MTSAEPIDNRLFALMILWHTQEEKEAAAASAMLSRQQMWGARW